jgi:hypothetical protein
MITGMQKMHPKWESILLTFIHLHRKATSRTVFSGNFMAILAYRITGASDAYLRAANAEKHHRNYKVQNYAAKANGFLLPQCC